MSIEGLSKSTFISHYLTGYRQHIIQSGIITQVVHARRLAPDVPFLTL